MAIKFLIVTLFFALVIIKPVHDSFPELDPKDPENGSGGSHEDTLLHSYRSTIGSRSSETVTWTISLSGKSEKNTDYLWYVKC
jgi:calcium permeable stress-gated cation channel